MLPRATRLVNRARSESDPAASTSAPFRSSAPGIVARPAARGLALERDLDAYHATLPGWYVQRNHADRERGKRGEPDYTAIPCRTVHGSHRVVVFDAKSTKAARWAVSLLAPHQAAAFQRITDLGHTAGVYLRLGTGPNAGDWWLPWSDLAEGWRAFYRERVTFYPVPRWKVEGMDWPATVERIRWPSNGIEGGRA